MNIDHINLFSSNLFRINIDPNSFNKNDIIDSVVRNYELQQERNEWDTNSKMHHYYNDWDNELFESIDLSTIIEQYKQIYENILNDLFNKPVTFKVEMENITVHKGNKSFMVAHNHIHDNIFLSSVHYIKCDENSSALTLMNPITYSEYPNLHTQKVTNKCINGSNVINSSHFKEWDYSIKEDEMLVFPSYLSHMVKSSKNENSDFRIAIVTNLKIFIKED